MPYSTDPELNKENAHSPSHVPMNEQLIYKIASLESTMSNSLRRLDEKFDRLLSDIHDRHIETTTTLNKVETEMRARFEVKRNRIDTVEKEIVRRTEQVEKDVLAEINKLCEKHESEKKAMLIDIEALKYWRTVIVTRMGMVGVGAFALWAIIGQPIQNVVARLFGTG